MSIISEGKPEPMKGLRGKEDLPFERYCAMVQKEAEKKSCIFFVNYEDGHEKEYGDLYLCDIAGYLIPKTYDNIDKFVSDWKKMKEKDEEHFCWAEWEKTEEGEIRISFAFYDNDGTRTVV